jgi:hypothetical protein
MSSLDAWRKGRNHKRFWLSWPQPTEDYRPLTDPPDGAVKGWWCSGYDSKERATLCALVDAASLTAAKNAIRRSWPEAPSARQVWRIESERDKDWLPGDRFPLSPWMTHRLGSEQVG